MCMANWPSWVALFSSYKEMWHLVWAILGPRFYDYFSFFCHKSAILHLLAVSILSVGRSLGRNAWKKNSSNPCARIFRCLLNITTGMRRQLAGGAGATDARHLQGLMFAVGLLWIVEWQKLNPVRNVTRWYGGGAPITRSHNFPTRFRF